MLTELENRIDPEFPSRLTGIGYQDVNRLRENLYRWANRAPESNTSRADDEIVLSRGDGPWISVVDGYAAFKNAYCCAEYNLKTKITPLLEGNGNRVILLLISQPETIRHHWIILSKATKS